MSKSGLTGLEILKLNYITSLCQLWADAGKANGKRINLFVLINSSHSGSCFFSESSLYGNKQLLLSPGDLLLFKIPVCSPVSRN